MVRGGRGGFTNVATFGFVARMTWCRGRKRGRVVRITGRGGRSDGITSGGRGGGRVEIYRAAQLMREICQVVSVRRGCE